MQNSTIYMNVRPEQLWSELSLGAKIAAGVATLALLGAALAASVFLAGAALFSALVMMVYSALAGKGEADEKQNL